MFLVIGATDDEALNYDISRDAENFGILCNIADRPAVCNFILPAIVCQGDLIIAVSTSGKSPAFAKKIRKELQQQYGPAYAKALDLLGVIRGKLLATSHAPEEHKPLFEALIGGGLVGLLEAGDGFGIDTLFKKVLGDGYRFDELMASLRQKP